MTATPNHDAEAPPTERARIIVVEDESLVAEDISQRLEMMGYEVCARVDTGQGAINAVREHRPDLVLMDIHLLGQMDGVEAARRIRVESGPPVVFVTAHADDTTLERIGGTEPYGYVLKPFDEREIKAAIETAFHRRRAEVRVMEIERKMQETQRLESLGTIAGGIAHDFNNLLHAITCNASLARTVSNDRKVVENCLLEIESTAHRASELCNQLLAYTGQGRMQKAEVDPARFIREILQLANIGIAKNATLHLNLPDGLPRISADRGQLQQIVMNLVLNASEALNGKPGEITITAKYEQLGGDFLATCHGNRNLKPGHYLMLEVADTGQGMAPDTQARIFDPFFTTKFTGRGLGLASVAGIVRAHGGGIAVQSSPGSGSVFRIVLPALQAAAPEQKTAAPKAGWKSTGCILLAEDELPLRIAGKSALRHFGFEVELAENGRETLDRIEKNGTHYRAIVLDLTMPVLDGQYAYQAIRALTPSLPILLVSGYAEDYAGKIFDSGSPTLFLHKPFSIGTLGEKLRELLGE